MNTKNMLSLAIAGLLTIGVADYAFATLVDIPSDVCGRGKDSVHDSVRDSSGGTHKIKVKTHHIRGCQNNDSSNKTDSVHQRHDSGKIKAFGDSKGRNTDKNVHKLLKDADSHYDKHHGVKDPVVVSDSSLDDSGVAKEFKKCTAKDSDSRKIDSNKAGKKCGDSGHKHHVLSQTVVTQNCNGGSDSALKTAILEHKDKVANDTTSTKDILVTESAYNDVQIQQAIQACIATGAKDIIATPPAITGATVLDATVVNAVVSDIKLTGANVSSPSAMTIDSTGNIVVVGGISGGTISGGTISGGILTTGTNGSGSVIGQTVSSGDITGVTLSGGTVNGGVIGDGTGATITAGTVTGGTVTNPGTTVGGVTTDITITDATLSNPSITVTGTTITGGSISGVTISGGTITGGISNGSTISGGTISGGTIAGGVINDPITVTNPVTLTSVTTTSTPDSPLTVAGTITNAVVGGTIAGSNTSGGGATSRSSTATGAISGSALKGRLNWREKQ